MQDQFRPWLIPTLVGVGSFGLGTVVGSVIAKRRHASTCDLREAVDDRERIIAQLAAEVEALDARVERLSVQEGQRIAVDYASIPLSQEAQLVADVKTNVFTGIDWNWEEEQEERTKDAPYILHRDEFINQEGGHKQIPLIWYDGDKILVDEDNIPVHNPQKVVGQLNFGHGSGDPDIVYIRNETLDAEYEVTRHPGHYTVEVLGAEIEEQYENAELQHSHRPRKFRME